MVRQSFHIEERKCEVLTAGSIVPKLTTFQVADAHKPLLSISARADMGYDCCLGTEGGNLGNLVRGKFIPLEGKAPLEDKDHEGLFTDVVASRMVCRRHMSIQDPGRQQNQI